MASKVDGVEIKCPVMAHVKVLERKWSLRVLLAISNGKTRFNDIQRALEGITPKMLSTRLKELERSNLVDKKTLSDKTVSYSLSASSKRIVSCWTGGCGQ